MSTTPTTLADLLPLRTHAMSNHMIVSATGLPVCRIASGYISAALGEQLAAHIVLTASKHDALVAALNQARAALDQCQHVPGVTEQAIWAIDAALVGVQ